MGEGRLTGKACRPGKENNVRVLKGNPLREDFPLGHSRTGSPQARGARGTAFR